MRKLGKIVLLVLLPVAMVGAVSPNSLAYLRQCCGLPPPCKPPMVCNLK